MIAVYLALLGLLGIYTYSQIDLNLTLFQAPVFLTFQQYMIQLGYYQRTWSAALFLGLIIGLFALYGYFLKNLPLLTKRQWFCSGVVIGMVTLLSYPAFSYDFFNYLFDARIVTAYGQNPYFFKALDFPLDPWIRFMHWIHRTYPYGPGWLLITTPLSFLGLGKFVLTAVLFKLLFIANYFLALFIIGKIYSIINPEKRTWALVFFGLNPLIIIETLISPHLDAIMTSSLLLGFYLILKQRKWLAFLTLIFSGSIKFLTWVLIPLHGIKLSFERGVELSLFLLTLILVPVILQREFYPWYAIPLLAIVALLPKRKFLHYLALVLSLGLLCQYGSFLYFGEYTTLTSLVKLGALLFPLVTLLPLYFVSKYPFSFKD